MKKIILFDIDRTLLDTDKTSVLHNECIAKILKTDDLEKIKSVKSNYKSTLSNEREYKAEEYLKILVKEFNSEKLEDLLDVYYGEKYKYTYKDAVYPEAVSVLEKLKSNYRLGIYSEGANGFQDNKFESMGISEYFEKDLTFILEAKDTVEAIKKIPNGAVVVDDKERICEFLNDNGIEVLWLNRKDDRKSDNFETIYSLLELPAIL